MKKLLLLITLFFAYTIHAMNETPLQTCRGIERLSPDAPASTYADFVKKITNAGLSVCKCIRTLTEDRINQTKPALEQEWGITAKHWREIEEFNTSVSQQDAQPVKLYVKSPTITRPDGKFMIRVPQADYLANKFMEVGKQNNTINLAMQQADIRGNENDGYTSTKVNIGVCRAIVLNENLIDYSRNTLNYHAIQPTDYTVTFGPLCFEYDNDSQQGNLLHEIYGHVLHSDSTTNSLLTFLACLKKPELCKNTTSFNAIQQAFNNSDSFKAYSCATEARADQFPAACSSTHNARLIESFARALNSDNANKKSISDNHHDDNATRLAWATRIRKLKEAEEALTKNGVAS